jgi:hypothetical protein
MHLSLYSSVHLEERIACTYARYNEKQHCQCYTVGMLSFLLIALDANVEI